MVIEFLASLVFGFVAFLIGLFPAIPSFSAFNGSLSSLIYSLSYLNVFVPLQLVSSCMVIALLVYNARFVWSLVMWLLRKLPLGVS